MKRILILWCLTVLPCLAGGLATLTSLSHEYGRPIKDTIDAGVDPISFEQLKETDFHSNGLNILVIHVSDSVRSIAISREAQFNVMEIPDILKPLSSFEDWTQKDDKTWVLANAKATAQWNGEGKIVVELDAVSAPASKGHSAGPAGHY